MWAEFQQRKAFWSVVILLPLVSVLVALWTLTLPNNPPTALESPAITPAILAQIGE